MKSIQGIAMEEHAVGMSSCIAVIHVSMYISVFQNSCETQICGNGGTCVMRGGEAICLCRPNYEGVTCMEHVRGKTLGINHNGRLCS